MTQQPDPWAQPAKPSDSVFPSLKQLSGRLVVVEPKTLEENVPDAYNPGQTKDRMTVDLTPLDGETITVSVDRNDVATPLPKPIGVGETIHGLYISQAVLITQVKPQLLSRGGTGMVLGRLGKGEARGGNNAPWVLYEASEEDNATARRWYAWRQNNQASAAMQQPAPAQQPQQQAPPPQQAPQYQQPPQQAPQYQQPPQQAPQYGGPNVDPNPPF